MAEAWLRRVGSATAVAHDLLNHQVCARCVLRLLNVREPDAYRVVPPPRRTLLDGLVSAETAETAGPSGEGEDGTADDASPAPCVACLGVLSLFDGEDNSLSVAAIVAGLREAGHVPQRMCVEVLLPISLALRERTLRCHVTRTWPPASPDGPAVRDVLRWMVEGPLSTAQGHAVDAAAELTVSLEFTHPAAVHETAWLLLRTSNTDDSRKRRREGGRGGKGVCFAFQKGKCARGDGCKFGHGGGDTPSEALSDEVGARVAVGAAAAEARVRIDQHLAKERQVRNVLSTVGNDAFAARCSFPPGGAAEAVALRVHATRQPSFLAGYYCKWVRGLSQTQWLAGDDHGGAATRVGDGSVEEQIALVLAPHLRADRIKFMAAGREDMDVRMLGGGRPFVLEVLNARELPLSRARCEQLQAELAARNLGVTTRCLQPVGRELRDKLKEGEAEKQKRYSAVVWAERELTPADLGTLRAVTDLVVSQSTPVRVLHRRSPMVRPRVIHSMQVEPVVGAPHCCVVHLVTQAGTYIKEFVHGDFGRTEPSLCTLLGCEVDILQLDVRDVEMEFL